MNKTNEFEYGSDINYSNEVNENYVKFDIDSNLHYRFSSAEDLLNDLDTLSAMIKHHHEYQVKRLNVLDDYYKARNTNIMDNRRRKEKEKADHRSAHNFGKVLCTFDVGYNTGNPIKVQIDNDELQEEIDEFNTNNDIVAEYLPYEVAPISISLKANNDGSLRITNGRQNISVTNSMIKKGDFIEMDIAEGKVFVNGVNKTRILDLTSSFKNFMVRTGDLVECDNGTPLIRYRGVWL